VSTRITILYDNTSTESWLTPHWGFSCLVETGDGVTVLFDAGGDDAVLRSNARRLGVDFRSIDTIVVSHLHFDHTGGLAFALHEAPDAVAWIPSSLRGVKRTGAIENVGAGPRRIAERVWTTGEIEGVEQSLVVGTNDGNIVITGCSHPSVGLILKTASTYGRVGALIGGLHDFSDYRVLEPLDLVCPTHCTRNIDTIGNGYGKIFVEGGVGRTIVFGDGGTSDAAEMNRGAAGLRRSLYEAYAAEPINTKRMTDPSAAAVITGPCGDTMEVYLDIEGGTIIGAFYHTDGCGATHACGSALTAIVTGKSVGDALSLSPGSIIDALGNLPEDHVHCAVLAVSTLHKALAEYLLSLR
jgi:7,8-dihydropterin-6-yl-methyl-4-(beta-D-ribofuranosyl)aminobenzene 5'-phosphate synthase